MQQAVLQNFSNTPRLRSCRMFTTCCSDHGGSRESQQESEIKEYHERSCRAEYETRNSQRIGGTTQELSLERKCTDQLPTDPRPSACSSNYCRKRTTTWTAQYNHKKSIVPKPLGREAVVLAPRHRGEVLVLLRRQRPKYPVLTLGQQTK